RLWFLDQLEPGSAAYNIHQAVRVRGDLDIGALEASFSEIVRRHEVLRTSFVMVDGEAVQQIAEPLSVEMPVIDLRQMREEEREAEAMEISRREAREGFDLEAGPLIRVKLV